MLQKIRQLFAAISGLCLAILFLVTFGQVIQRYVFQMAMPWATDVTRIFFIYSVFFGMAVGVFNKSHLNIDVLVKLLPGGLRSYFALLSNIVVIVFLGAVFYYSIPFAQANADQLTPYLLLPMTWIYMVIPVTVAFMLLSLAIDTLRLLRDLFLGRSVEGENKEGR